MEGPNWRNNICLAVSCCNSLCFFVVSPGTAASEENMYTNVSVNNAKKMVEEGNIFIFDVHTPDESNAAHIKGNY